MGLHSALIEGQQRSLVADLVPAERRATAFGAYYTVVGLALLPASVIAGLLWERFGARATFSVDAALALAAAACFMVLLPLGSERQDRRETERAGAGAGSIARASAPGGHGGARAPASSALIRRLISGLCAPCRARGSGRATTRRWCGRAARRLAITTDARVEKRHYRRAWARIRGIGATPAAMTGHAARGREPERSRRHGRAAALGGAASRSCSAPRRPGSSPRRRACRPASTLPSRRRPWPTARRPTTGSCASWLAPSDSLFQGVDVLALKGEDGLRALPRGKTLPFLGEVIIVFHQERHAGDVVRRRGWRGW